MKRYLLIALITVLTLGALFGIYVFIFGSFKETELRILATLFVVGGYSLTALCCSIWFDRHSFLALAYAGLLVSGAGCIIDIAIIWELIDHSSRRIEWLDKTALSLGVLAVTLAYWSMLLLLRSGANIVNNIVYFTMGCVSVVSMMLIGEIVFEWRVEEQYYRALGVFVILMILGTIVAPILRKVLAMNKPASN
ncbi:MAG: hypothetical protein ACYC6O_01220 [Thermoleophilia bacterium]